MGKNKGFKRFIGDFEGKSTSLEGRLDFSKTPRSTPPLLEDRFDLLKGPRSNPPLSEGPLEISKRPSSMGGGGSKKTGGVLQSDARIKRTGAKRSACIYTFPAFLTGHSAQRSYSVYSSRNRGALTRTHDSRVKFVPPFSKLKPLSC